jgi:hypothetical protein
MKAVFVHVNGHSLIKIRRCFSVEIVVLVLEKTGIRLETDEIVSVLYVKMHPETRVLFLELI